MCKTCNGTGGINIDHGWHISFNPCPDTNCDFVPDDSAIRILEAKLAEMEAMKHEHVKQRATHTTARKERCAV